MDKIDLLLNFSKEFFLDSKYVNINPRVFKILIDLIDRWNNEIINYYKIFYLSYFFNDITILYIEKWSKFLKINELIVKDIKSNKKIKVNITKFKNELNIDDRNLSKERLLIKLKSFLLEIEYMKYEFKQKVNTINNIQNQLRENNKDKKIINNNQIFIYELNSVIQTIIIVNKKFNKKEFKDNKQKLFIGQLFKYINYNFEIKTLIKFQQIIYSFKNLFKDLKEISFELYESKLYDAIETKKISSNLNNNIFYNNNSSFKDSLKESSYKIIHFYLKTKKSFQNNFNESKVNNIKESFNNESFKEIFEEIIFEMDSKNNSKIIKEKITEESENADIKKKNYKKNYIKNKKYDNFKCKCIIF